MAMWLIVFSKTTKSLSFEEGDKVWLRDLPKAENKHFNKLKRIWQGPFEVLKCEGGNRYVIDTPQGPRVYSIDRLKSYCPALSGLKVPLYYHADIEAPPEDDGRVVQEILGHERRPHPRRRGQKRLFWHVHWKGAEKPSWVPGSQFVHHITDNWLQYNKRHNIKVD